MDFVADFHLHSKYSRAVSQNMVLSEIAKWADKKGIHLVSASDFTHPLWFREIKSQLIEESSGIYKLKNPPAGGSKALFILSTEISSIYSQGGKTRRIHNLVFVPAFDAVEKLNSELLKRGSNLSSDGRPIIGLSSRNLLDLVLSVDSKAFLIPCHAWTPWFSIFGSNSGFDSIDECFEDLSSEIFGIETGLSSDPEMNWRIKELEGRSILSFSDAHSTPKMGREATVFEIKNEKLKMKNYNSKFKITYGDIRSAIKKDPSSKLEIGYTIEFYPEEGKYHYTGHRNCKIVQSPQETKEKGVICPVCKRPLTVGVMHRVDQLADPEFQPNIKTKMDEFGVTWIEDPKGLHPPFVKLVPLVEIIAESLETTPSSFRVLKTFDEMCNKFSSELEVLLKTKIYDIEKYFGPKIAEGIAKVRMGDIFIEPGFDGEYGRVKIWGKGKDQSSKTQPAAQLGLEF